MAAKELFKEYPELLDYLENEEYKKFSDFVIDLWDSSNWTPKYIFSLFNELTKKLYEADLLDDIIISLGEIPEWCKFFEFTSYEIPYGVKKIDYAFLDCKYLKSVTIPNSVISIGGVALSGCASLTSIIIPNSVKTIGNSAFAYCSSLKSITIPEGVTEIGSNAFSHCKSLTSITIPNSVTEIKMAAFNGCSSLTDIYIDMFEDGFIKACGTQKYREKLWIPNQTKIHFK